MFFVPGNVNLPNKNAYAKQLERFLVRVIRHPNLRSNSPVYDFLFLQSSADLGTRPRSDENRRFSSSTAPILCQPLAPSSSNGETSTGAWLTSAVKDLKRNLASTLNFQTSPRFAGLNHDVVPMQRQSEEVRAEV
jgi:hypothetical protein